MVHNGIEETPKHVSVGERTKEGVGLLNLPPSHHFCEESKDTKKLKALKKKSHYKDYFPPLCGWVQKQIAFQYFINKWACEQWRTDGSIVLKPNSWMQEGKRSLRCLRSRSQSAKTSLNVCADLLIMAGTNFRRVQTNIWEGAFKKTGLYGTKAENPEWNIKASVDQSKCWWKWRKEVWLRERQICWTSQRRVQTRIRRSCHNNSGTRIIPSLCDVGDREKKKELESSGFCLEHSDVLLMRVCKLLGNIWSQCPLGWALCLWKAHFKAHIKVFYGKP